MDGQTLQQLFAGSNPFLAQMGEKAFNQVQQKEQANLASIMGAEQRAQAMHPLEMTARETTNRLNASTAGLNEYALKTKPDADTARKSAMQEMLNKMDDATRGQFKQQVTRNMQIAAMAKANGGRLPEGMQMSPEELQMFRPENLDKIIKHGQTFLEFDPEEIGKRQRAAEAERLAKIRGQVQMDVKGTPSAGGGKNNPTMAPPKMNLQQQYGFYNNLAFAEQDPEKKKAYQAEADRIELMILRQAVNAQQARQAGDPNLADPKLGGLPVNPMPTPQPTPRAGGWTPPPGWKVN